MNDSERPPPPPGRTTATVGFNGYMARIDARLTHLSMLLDLPDLDPVLEVASSAVRLWLLGLGAYRALVERAREGDGATSPDTQAARQRLNDTYARLLEVLRLAYAELEGHPTRNALDDQRTQLVTAAAALDSDAAPTPNAPAPAKAPPTDD